MKRACWKRWIAGEKRDQAGEGGREDELRAASIQRQLSRDEKTGEKKRRKGKLQRLERGGRDTEEGAWPVGRARLLGARYLSPPVDGAARASVERLRPQRHAAPRSLFSGGPRRRRRSQSCRGARERQSGQAGRGTEGLSVGADRAARLTEQPG